MRYPVHPRNKNYQTNPFFAITTYNFINLQSAKRTGPDVPADRILKVEEDARTGFER